MNQRKKLLRQNEQYAAIITANLMEVNYRRKDGDLFTGLMTSYVSGRAYKAAHLEVENRLEELK